MNGAVRIEPASVSIASAGSPLVVRQVGLGGVPRGMVIVASGSASHDTVDVQNALAEHGYESVVLPQPFRASDSAATRSANVIADLLRHVNRRGWAPEQVGLICFGDGAWLGLHAAVAFELGAAVSVSPTPSDGLDARRAATVLASARRLRTPWLGLIAGSARVVAELDATLTAMSTPGVGSTLAHVVSYPGAPQNFFEPTREVVTHAAGFDAWQRSVEWLNLRVVPRPTPLDQRWRSRRGRPAGH